MWREPEPSNDPTNEPSNDPTSGQSNPSTSELFDVLADQRRRYVLDLLRERGEALTLGDVAEEVAAREAERAGAGPSNEDVRRIRLTLRHLHLPKLADAGVVVHDRERRTVALAVDPGLLDTFLGPAVAE